MASKSNLNATPGPKPAFSRHVAKQIATRQMYTASGDPIHNLEAYMAAGGQPHNSSGQAIHNPTAYRNAIEASVRQNTTDPKYLYHYTTPEAADSIAESGRLEPSSGGLAGPGMYCTAKPPRSSTANLLQNNYGSATARDASFVQHYARIDTDTLDAEHVGDDRNVWLVNGPVDLEQHGGYVAERNVDKSGGTAATQGGYDSGMYTMYDDESDDPRNAHGMSSYYESNDGAFNDNDYHADDGFDPHYAGGDEDSDY